MKSDCAYQYSAVDMKFVMENPEEYVIPEVLEACKLLWSKNIFTVMCNNYENDHSWITINTLSEENQKIFDSFVGVDERFGTTWGGIGFKIPIKPEVGVSTYDAFKEVIDLFSVQDVQKDGYMDVETFMTFYTDCYKMISNPEYVYSEAPKREDFLDESAFFESLLKHMDANSVPKTIRKFDETKMVKSLDDYINESKFKDFYDADEGKIFYNEIYYNAHMSYKKNIKTSKLN